MTTLKFLSFVKYFTAITILISSVFMACIYFSPTHSLVDYSVMYGFVLGLFIIILLLIVLAKTFIQPANRRQLLFASFLLFVNIVLTIGYYFIWNYATRSILIKITNNTGQKATDTGLYGCHEQNWGDLNNGESKTVRLPGDISCMYIVTYKLNGIIKHESLPRQDFTTNVYLLGTNPNIVMEE